MKKKNNRAPCHSQIKGRFIVFNTENWRKIKIAAFEVQASTIWLPKERRAISASEDIVLKTPEFVSQIARQNIWKALGELN